MRSRDSRKSPKPYTIRMRLHPLLVLTLLVSNASAQIAQPVSTLVAQPALQGFTLEGNTLSNGSATLTLERKGDLLKAATVKLAASDTVQMGKLLNALTGYDFAEPLVGFLKQNNAPLEAATAAKPLNVNAEEYTLSFYKQKDILNLNVALTQIPESVFRKVNLIKGKVDAPIVIRVYSDFQCPYCQKLEGEFLMAYARKLPRDVRLEFHHVPLEQIHPNARPSAEASECAAEQKKFWEYHEALFVDRSWMSLKDPSGIFNELAKKVKLNTRQFSACFSSRKYKSVVDAALEAAGRLGIRGTPTVYVGGYKLGNAYDPAAYERLYKLLR